ncbi:MAG TPA: alpha/beta hydrolase [Aldersonia sp.]
MTSSSQADLRVRLFLGTLKACGWPPLHQRTVRQARHDFRILVASTGSWRPVRNVDDAVVAGPQGRIPVRVYRPGGGADRPLVVYFHGGGFVIGDLFTADGLCRRLANASGATVVSVHYRRAPEHPLPAPQIDAYAATCWALRHARSLGADPGRLVVAGDSAGGGLAAHIAARLRDEGPTAAALQVLFNPGLDFTLEHADRDPALAQLLDWDTIGWFADHSVPPPVDRTDPLISPARGDLSGLPKAVILTAGVDPFRADAEHYARALTAAGSEADVHDFPGQIHGFNDMDLLFPAAKRSLQTAARAIRATVSPAVPTGLAAHDTIAWAGPDRGRLRRLRETGARTPFLNGPDTLWTLLNARLSSSPDHPDRLASGAPK